MERLAALEHEQWMEWSRAVAVQVSPEQRRRWEVNWVPYDQLPEAVKEQDRVYARKVLAVQLHKSYGSGVGDKRELALHQPKGRLGEGPGVPRPVLDSHALVQRPDHPMPVAGRVVSVGEHGIHLRTDGGDHVKVRHEHVLDHQPPIGPDEFPEAARTLHRTHGIPFDVEDRFAKPNSRGKQGPADGARQLIEALEQQGVPIDGKKLLEEGSPEEIEEVLSRYVNLEPKPSQMPTVVTKDRMHDAPDWENVFPEGNGRVSRQRKPPKRRYAADNDSARDSGYDEIKQTKMVSGITVSPEVDPEDQEHILRVASAAFQSLADILEPMDDAPKLVIEPTHPDEQERAEDVGAHYDRRANRLIVGLGMPESIVHAYGHAVDRDLGEGRYASMDPKGPLGPVMEALTDSQGHRDLASRFEDDGGTNADPAKRFWASPPEVFARFFEQYVDRAVGAAKEPGDHHAYVRGVQTPGELSDEDAKNASKCFKKVLAHRDRSGLLALGKTRSGGEKFTEVGQNDQVGKLRETGKQPAHRDPFRQALLDEAGQSDHPAGKRIVAGLTHGISHQHIAKKKYDDPDLAVAHAGIVARAKKRMEDPYV